LIKRKCKCVQACCACHSFFSSLTSLYSNLLFHSYKQNKFNLLREPLEGFSKLITEVTSVLPPPHSPATALPLELSSICPQACTAIWEQIVSLMQWSVARCHRDDALSIIPHRSPHLRGLHHPRLVMCTAQPKAGSRLRPSPNKLSLTGPSGCQSGFVQPMAQAQRMQSRKPRLLQAP
jgi:THO complex subunit 2 N-terminus